MISFINLPKLEGKWATPVLVTKFTVVRPAFIPCTLVYAHKSHSSHFIHPSSALLFDYTSEQYKHGDSVEATKGVPLAAKVSPRYPTLVGGGRHFCLQCDDLRAYHFTHYY